MVYAYRLSDGQFLRGYPQTPPYDPETEGVQEYPTHARPDMRLHRFDALATTKMRLATAQELADYDAARESLIEQARFDDEKMLKAVAIWTAQKLNIPLLTARQEIVAIYRGLN